MRISVCAIVVAAFALTVPCAVEIATAAETIHVSYNWGGLGPRRSESYDIVRDGERYKVSAAQTTAAFGTLDPSDKVERATYELPASAIEALVAALRAPPMTKAEALAALTTPAWLSDNSAAAYQTITATPCAESARALFLSRFQDPRIARAALDQYFTGMWTDDYPWASVEADLPQIGKVERTTGSQKAFMLPWRNGEREDWNPALGRAIGALLPDNSAGKDRLLGSDLLSRLADYVLTGARDAWEDLEQRCISRRRRS